tara:strand:- start:108 stop:620 length:513 start_codon:yes stop_codon:yes gene_type:complete
MGAAMITPEFARMMARYNSWQNGQMAAAMAQLDETALRAARGAFFGSILRTASHVLWGDTIWMSRFQGVEPPAVSIAQSPEMFGEFEGWQQARLAMDARIEAWAGRLEQGDIDADLTWYSGLSKAEMRKPMSVLVVHLFNHQTHHRGQISAMLTAAGQAQGPTDLPWMPS